jgi:3-oxoacyl-[acyl-carrier protein] reductase
MSVEGRRIQVVGAGELAHSLSADLRRLGAVLADPVAALVGTDIVEGTVLRAAVFAPWDRTAMTPRPLIELTDAEFNIAWQQTMDAAIAMCLGAREAFGGRGGNIVLTFPTTAFVGGAMYAHWAAAAEGVHILTKSVARQWGPEGIAVNALALDPALVLADPDAAGPVSIAQPAVAEPDAADALAFLCSPEARKLAGQTLTVDGGVWM